MYSGKTALVEPPTEPTIITTLSRLHGLQSYPSNSAADMNANTMLTHTLVEEVMHLSSTMVRGHSPSAAPHPALPAFGEPEDEEKNCKVETIELVQGKCS